MSRREQRQPAWNGTDPLAWYRLIDQAETVRAQWGLGLANVWHHINRMDYNRARSTMDAMMHHWPAQINAGAQTAAPTTDDITRNT